MCIAPIIIENPRWKKVRLRSDQRFLAVPCGHCSECLNSRRNAWSFRLKVEASYYDDKNMAFVSLDYSPQHLPLSPYYYPTFNKDHLKKYIKDLRNHFGNSFKYYSIGEYGETKGRPHYHILFFGIPVNFDFSKYWTYGRTDVGYVEEASVHYVAGYFMLTDNFDKDYQDSPFNYMSKNIGLRYYQDHKLMLLDFVKRNIPLHIGNFTVPVPRYFKKLLKKEFRLPSFKNQFTPLPVGDSWHLIENYKNKHCKKQKLSTIKN